MSVSAALDLLIHQARETQVNKYAAYSRLALLAYDLILSASREKELIWGQEIRASSVIYLFLRYPVIAFQVFNVCISYTSQHEVCDALYRFTWALSIIVTRMAITASFMLRVYAMMGLSRIGLIVSGFVGLVGASTIGLDVWQDVQVSCSTSSNPISTVVTFFMLAAFDVLTTGILAISTMKILATSGMGAYRNEGLLSVVINQGLLYFVVVSAVQIIVIVLYYLPQGVYSLVLNNYALLISSVLLSRFLLDLREMHANSGENDSPQCGTTFTDIPLEGSYISDFERRIVRSLAVRDFVDRSFDNEAAYNEYDLPLHA